jgi:hypothetical protein
MAGRMRAIALELRAHAPFTLFGAATGIVCMLVFARAGHELNHRLFLVFHPAHVVLSAMVTASLFKLMEKKTGFLAVLVVGYLGAIGVATLSDCVLPFFGESLLGVAIPLHSHDHGEDAESGHLHEDANHAHEDAEHAHEMTELAHSHTDHADGHDPEGVAPHSRSDADERGVLSRIHLGFIEDWYVVNPAAILGVLIGYFLPRTRFPHAGHVLISTWASSFHVLMNTQRELSPTMFVGVFIVLFVAVWLPCCISDIVFPLLFVRSGHLPIGCHHHRHAEATA